MYLDSESKTRLTSLNVDGPFAGSARRKTERTNKMKKLMIVAAVAAMGSAFAVCGIQPGPTPAPTGSTAWAYNWRFVAGTRTQKGVRSPQRPLLPSRP